MQPHDGFATVDTSVESLGLRNNHGYLHPEVLDRVAEVASMAAVWEVVRLTTDEHANRNDSVQLSHPNSNGNEMETAPPEKKKVPRNNKDKHVDITMCKFLEKKGVLATKDYFPDKPSQRLVDAFEEHGVAGPDPNSPRVCLTQTFKGKWNKEVVELLTTSFITTVEKETYQPVQMTWPQMVQDNIRKRCQNKLYRTQYLCRTREESPRADSDKVNCMYQRRQEMYYRRRKILDLNYDREPKAWEGVRVLLDALDTRGMSDDETDDECKHLNRDLK
ncbi:hypothetical protein BC827DRAFT_1272546 [Russula dissimulans]|nr:hypothetical protein BC827DRAFT_1272546 [Russula dissimulans]